ncbi:MAG: CoA-binding protein [Acidobacteriota bacterium]|nr:CoA-binding protein [Acidobacteriota bacterium]
MNEPEVVQAMLDARVIAVVGLSSDPAKPSHYVSRYMQRAGYRIVPVNPTLDGATVLGERSYASLGQATPRPDLVNVFRLPNAIPAIVDEMLQLGLTALWVQQGIVNLDAAQRAERGGIRVVMNRRIMVEHGMLRTPPRTAARPTPKG